MPAPRLDVLTPRGRAATAAEAVLTAAVGAAYRATFVHTPPDGPARLDGAFVRGGTIAALAENKVRSDTRAQFRLWGDTYLITASKIDDGVRAAATLGVPFVVCAYLVPDATVYVWRICDDSGKLTFDIARRATRTQATCNGGSAVRVNAFLPFAAARTVPVAHPGNLSLLR